MLSIIVEENQTDSTGILMEHIETVYTLLTWLTQTFILAFRERTLFIIQLMIHRCM